LQPGARLGPDVVLEKLGEGGMGNVYKARDARLDRLVAIKRSAKEFSDRFEREARAAAALNRFHSVHHFSTHSPLFHLQLDDCTISTRGGFNADTDVVRHHSAASRLERWGHAGANHQ
jgi:serine/threonine protein kinase